MYYAQNKEKIKERKKNYKENNKEKVKIQKLKSQRKSLSTPTGRLKHNIRAAINRSLIESGYEKHYTSEKILGCSIQYFKKYLESKFEPWMNWENKGKYNGQKNYGWDIDHIIPLSSAKTEKDVIELNHHKNIQPLCSYINRDVKKNKLIL